MTNLEKWTDRYRKSWCTKEQLKRLVQLQVLAELEYQAITGEGYE